MDIRSAPQNNMKAQGITPFIICLRNCMQQPIRRTAEICSCRSLSPVVFSFSRLLKRQWNFQKIKMVEPLLSLTFQRVNRLYTEQVMPISCHCGQLQPRMSSSRDFPPRDETRAAQSLLLRCENSSCRASRFAMPVKKAVSYVYTQLFTCMFISKLRQQ